jgi:hypothetical protein
MPNAARPSPFREEGAPKATPNPQPSISAGHKNELF